MDIIRWIVPLFVALVIFLIIGWFTGNKEYGAKDEERSQLIKQRAIVGSWIFLLIMLVINIIFSFFGLRTVLLKGAPFNHPKYFI